MGRKYVIEFADTVSDEQVEAIAANHRAAVGLYKSVVEVTDQVRPLWSAPTYGGLKRNTGAYLPPCHLPEADIPMAETPPRPFRVGDKVVDAKYPEWGEGEVKDVAYPVHVRFSRRHSVESYALDGRYYRPDQSPRLKHIEP